MLPEDEFRLIMKTVALHMKSIFMYAKIFCHSGKNPLKLKRPESFKSVVTVNFLASYCFLMHDKLLHGNDKSESARMVSNILYEEVKKHEANRQLLVVFDEDFITQQQCRDSETYTWLCFSHEKDNGHKLG